MEGSRFSILSTDTFGIDLEYNEQFAIIHFAYVNKFTKTVYLELVERQKGLIHFLRTMGFEHVWAGIPEQNFVTQKLAMKMGWDYVGQDGEITVYKYKED